MRTWIVNVGPNKGRGSSHAHGPVTRHGAVRTVPASEAAGYIDSIASAVKAGVDPDLIVSTCSVYTRDIRGQDQGVQRNG